MAEGAHPAAAAALSVNSRLAKKLAESAEDIADREARRFLGMNRELGLGATFGFMFMMIFCAGALIYFIWVVLPDRQQLRKNQEADNGTKATIASAVDKLANAYNELVDQSAEHRRETAGIKTEVSLLRAENSKNAEKYQQNQQDQSRVLSEIRDRLPAPPTPK